MFLASAFQCCNVWTGRDSCCQGDPRISIRIRPTFQCALIRVFGDSRWDLCDKKTYVLYWNIKKHTFGKNHFCVGKIIIWACDWHLFICFVLFLFSFLFTQYIMNKMAAFTSTRQLRIESILQVQLHRWISNPWLSTRSLLLLG